MTDITSLVKSIDSATKVANTPLFTTIIDKVTGFKISEWTAEGEIRKKLIHDEYEKAKENGIMGMQYIEYMRDTENLINTAVRSSKYIDPNKSNDIKMDNDFFWNTINHAKSVSNDEMQELVAKIIAGEYNEPGTYSMSTLQTLKMLGKNELELFERICSLCIHNHQIPAAVFEGVNDIRPILKSIGVGYGNLLELQNLGLILSNTISLSLENPTKKNFSMIYINRPILFEPTHETKWDMKLSEYYELSPTGKQIIKHLNPNFSEEYYKWLILNYKLLIIK